MFEYFQSEKDSQWYFHFKNQGNHEIQCVSEGYSSKGNCLRGIDDLKEAIKLSEVRINDSFSTLPEAFESEPKTDVFSIYEEPEPAEDAVIICPSDGQPCSCDEQVCVDGADS